MLQLCTVVELPLISRLSLRLDCRQDTDLLRPIGGIRWKGELQSFVNGVSEQVSITAGIDSPSVFANAALR